MMIGNLSFHDVQNRRLSSKYFRKTIHNPSLLDEGRRSHEDFLKRPFRNRNFKVNKLNDKEGQIQFFFPRGRGGLCGQIKPSQTVLDLARLLTKPKTKVMIPILTQFCLIY